MSEALAMDAFQSPSGSGTTTTWKDILSAEKEKPYFKELLAFVASERASKKTIYPADSDIFNAIRSTPFEDLRVVILGQDPYHGPGQAHGLCFSVKPGVPPPPSLQNIFKELKSDVGIPIPSHGCLQSWAKQGILLLNTVLTVEQAKPQSHAGKGWEQFTDTVIRAISDHKRGVVFLLWGSPAQRKAELIDSTKHHILRAPHPSPLSAARGFLGCKHFSKANELLKAQGLSPVSWELSL
jgi:uracil-DNA glycosylase